MSFSAKGWTNLAFSRVVTMNSRPPNSRKRLRVRLRRSATRWAAVRLSLRPRFWCLISSSLALDRRHIHAEGVPHIGQSKFDLVEGRLSKVAQLEELGLGAPDQIADRLDTLGLEAVERAGRKLEAVDRQLHLVTELVVLDPRHGRFLDLKPFAGLAIDSELGVLNEGIEMAPEDFRRLDERHVGRDRPVRPDLHDQTIIVRALADAGVLGLVTDAAHGRERRVHPDHADLVVALGVLLRGVVSAPLANDQIDVERNVLRERRDVLVGIDDLHLGTVLDIPRPNLTLGGFADSDLGRVARAETDEDILEVEDHLGHVLVDAGHARELVLHALDLRRDD